MDNENIEYWILSMILKIKKKAGRGIFSNPCSSKTNLGMDYRINFQPKCFHCAQNVCMGVSVCLFVFVCK